jgi:hypothetical protein
MNAQEQWISKTLSSLDGAGRAELNPLVREKILEQAMGLRREKRTLTMQTVWKIAAVALVLISLNLFTMVRFHRSVQASQNPVHSMAGEYFSYLSTINF